MTPNRMLRCLLALLLPLCFAGAALAQEAITVRGTGRDERDAIKHALAEAICRANSSTWGMLSRLPRTARARSRRVNPLTYSTKKYCPPSGSGRMDSTWLTTFGCPVTHNQIFASRANQSRTVPSFWWSRCGHLAMNLIFGSFASRTR